MILQHNKQLLIYANSSHEMGGGHILRQFALAQAAIKKHFQVTFIYHQCSQGLLKKITVAGFSAKKLTNALLNYQVEKEHACALIIDDYALSAYQKSLFSLITCPIIIFDDQTDADDIIADMIVNSAEQITPQYYESRTSAKIYCLGNDYRLCRQEFLEQRAQLSHFSQRKRILISLGASDVRQLTLPIVSQLLAMEPSLPLDIVIGEMAKSDEANWQQLTLSFKSITLHHNVEDMSKLMAASGMAITTAGGTLYELACLGVPSIALCIIDNQRSSLQSGMNKNGYIAFDLSKIANNDNMVSILLPVIEQSLVLWQQPEQRLQMSKNLQKNIDGLGSHRIMTTIETLINLEKES